MGERKMKSKESKNVADDIPLDNSEMTSIMTEYVERAKRESEKIAKEIYEEVMEYRKSKENEADHEIQE